MAFGEKERDAESGALGETTEPRLRTTQVGETSATKTHRFFHLRRNDGEGKHLQTYETSKRVIFDTVGYRTYVMLGVNFLTAAVVNNTPQIVAFISSAIAGHPNLAQPWKTNISLEAQVFGGLTLAEFLVKYPTQLIWKKGMTYIKRGYKLGLYNVKELGTAMRYAAKRDPELFARLVNASVEEETVTSSAREPVIGGLGAAMRQASGRIKEIATSPGTDFGEGTVA